VRNPSSPSHLVSKGAKARPFPFRPLASWCSTFHPLAVLDPLPNQRQTSATGTRWTAGFCNALLATTCLLGGDVGTNHHHHHHDHHRVFHAVLSTYQLAFGGFLTIGGDMFGSLESRSQCGYFLRRLSLYSLREDSKVVFRRGQEKEVCRQDPAHHALPGISLKISLG
jgi:hypothetical protein